MRRRSSTGPNEDGAPEFDARQPFEVVRHPTSLMIGGPTATLVWQALAWCIGIFVVLAPLAVYRYRERT